MKAGGESGEALNDAEAMQSLLWRRIESDEMPEGGKKLTAAEKQIILSWISAGAPTLRNEPDEVAAAKYTAEELGHWSCQPIADVAIPAVGDGLCGRQLMRSLSPS